MTTPLDDLAFAWVNNTGRLLYQSPEEAPFYVPALVYGPRLEMMPIFRVPTADYAAHWDLEGPR